MQNMRTATAARAVGWSL